MGARDAIAKLLTGIKAYHSSPHDFDRFDISKIGTGEGAQVYGHGLYFAENPKVSGQGGQYWNQFSNRFSGPEAEAAIYLKSAGFDRGKAAQMMQEHINKVIDAGGADPSLMNAKIETLKLLESGNPVGPRTYEVNIKADPTRFLDWDKSMSAQPEVMDRIRPLFSDYRLAPSNYLGESVHKEIRDFHMGHGMSKPAAAEATAIDLRSAGIPGIKYLDEGSRISSPEQIKLIRENIAQREALHAANPNPTDLKWLEEYRDMLRRAENPTSNYVVFDPANVDILKKYGVVGAPAGALTMGAAYDQSKYDVPQSYEEPDPMAGTFR
jgi:hypothetical protein